MWSIGNDVSGHYKHKFFDPSTPSMRKGRNGKKWEKNGKKMEEKKLMFIVATNVVANGPHERLECLTLMPIK